MDKRLYIAVVIIFAAALFGLIGYNYFEIYEYKEQVYASREVLSNNYYAMDLWLTESGFQVRVENEFNAQQLAEAAEKVVMAHSRVFFIHDDDAETISRWIKQGGFFIFAIDHYNDALNENIPAFLSKFGITHEYIERPAAAAPETAEKDKGNESKTETGIETYSLPDFQNRTAFLLDNEDDFFSIKDIAGNIRLAEISIGDGMLTVIGTPVFMNNYNLEKEANALLAWKLTGARVPNKGHDKKGILFIRPSNSHASNSLIKTIMERGNLVPVVISALILIFTGFWMVIPGFGLVPEEKQRVSRPLKDRFKAEIRFLKKYRALDHYLDAYTNFQHEQKSSMEKTYDYRELINHYRRLIDGTTKI